MGTDNPPRTDERLPDKIYHERNTLFTLEEPDNFVDRLE